MRKYEKQLKSREWVEEFIDTVGNDHLLLVMDKSEDELSYEVRGYYGDEDTIEIFDMGNSQYVQEWLGLDDVEDVETEYNSMSEEERAEVRHGIENILIDEMEVIAEYTV